MEKVHPKAIRRRLLEILYQRYLDDPLEMLTPEDFLSDALVTRENLVANIHYLSDRDLVELMIGYNPPMFAAARIRANGIDLVENRFEFNRRFPAAPGQAEEAGADLPLLIERLTEEADFAPLDGDERSALLRDVQYLRDEVARPAHRWRHEVVKTVLGWIEAPFDDVREHLPTLGLVSDAIEKAEAEAET